MDFVIINEVAPIKKKFVRMIYDIQEIVKADINTSNEILTGEYRIFRILTTCRQGTTKYFDVNIHKENADLIDKLMSGKNKWFEFSKNSIKPATKPKF